MLNEAAESQEGLESDPAVQLMLQAKSGDAAAFEQLFASYSKRLVTFAYRMIRNHWRAEELVQDAFLQIYRARDRYQPKARFSTYAYRVVTNKCLNEIRGLSYRSTAPEDIRRLTDDTSLGPEQRVIGRETIARVGAILFNHVPAKQRAALLLSRVEGFDYHDIAEALGVSASSVKSLVFRATRTLREQLEESARR